MATTGHLAAEQLFTQLERGTVVTRFHVRRRAERHQLAVRRETGQLVALRAATATAGHASGGDFAPPPLSLPGDAAASARFAGAAAEVVLDLRVVQRVTQGSASHATAAALAVEFGRVAADEPLRPPDAGCCLLVEYGATFRWRRLAVAFVSRRECDVWRRGLTSLAQLVRRHSGYVTRVGRWLFKHYYLMEPSALCADTDGTRSSKAAASSSMTPSAQADITSAQLKALKAFCTRVGYRITTARLKELLQQLRTARQLPPAAAAVGAGRFQLEYDELMHVHNRLLWQPSILPDVFVQSGDLALDTTAAAAAVDPTSVVSLSEFGKFLSAEQCDVDVDELATVAQVVRHFVQDRLRQVGEPYLSREEVLSYLFSRANQLWDERVLEERQDMSQPLAHYWIASSHNTYLTGDQFISESSVDAYARCLLQGCRCVELDCWDGPDGMPVIYHGHTLTTKIRLMDVLRCIRQHAFTVSEYPLILSIEDHCCLQQQRRMAAAFHEVLGALLLTAPVDPRETQLPSPQALRHKILIKHKKLPHVYGDTAQEVSGATGGDSCDSHAFDESSSQLSGSLYLLDSETGEWRPMLFALTGTRLLYTEPCHSIDAGSDDDSFDTLERDQLAPLHTSLSPLPSSCSSHTLGLTTAAAAGDTTAAAATHRSLLRRSISSSGSGAEVGRKVSATSSEELHFGEKWFHGRLAGGRQRAEQLLQQHAPQLGDGTFLVRESDTFVGDYSLSFWHAGRCHHCRIRTRPERGAMRYYLVDTALFDCLYSLITHYRQQPLRTQQLQLLLRRPVPQQLQHTTRSWFHGQCSRQQAERWLRRVPLTGAFLVRASQHEPGAFVVSLRDAAAAVKHCRVRCDGRLYTVDGERFESLVQLVAHYETVPLYRHVRLRHALTHALLARYCGDGGGDGESGSEFKTDWDECGASVHNNNNNNNGSGDTVSDDGAYLEPGAGGAASVRAIHEYEARREDELSFSRHAVITSVCRATGEQGWWRGDYGGQRQLLFPSNYVEPLCEDENGASGGCGGAGGGGGGCGGRGGLMTGRGLVHLAAASVERVECTVATLAVHLSDSVASVAAQSAAELPLDCAVRVWPQQAVATPLFLGCTSSAVASDWLRALTTAAKLPALPPAAAASAPGVSAGSSAAATPSGKTAARSLTPAAASQRRDLERVKRIAQQLSALIVYCQTEPFDADKLRTARSFREMSSFSETKVDKWLQPGDSVRFFLWYNRLQLSRVYPKGQRIDSSNYNPMPVWNGGCQMAALNYQTGDRGMQLHRARFRLNAGCGYVLRPAFTLADSYSPHDRHCLPFSATVYTIQVLGARHLARQMARDGGPGEAASRVARRGRGGRDGAGGLGGGGVFSPFVELEVVGASYDNCNKYTTRVAADNGLSPVWRQTCRFTVHCPPTALLRFVVYDEDSFGERVFVGQSTAPLVCVRPGWRSVPLANGHDEPLELAALLVHVRVDPVPPPAAGHCRASDEEEEATSAETVVTAIEGLLLPDDNGGTRIAPLHTS